MLKIGLTGPTGSGKSTVTALMRQWGGVENQNADAMAHEVMESAARQPARAPRTREASSMRFSHSARIGG